MTEQQIVDGLLSQIDWAVKHNRSREEVAWIVNTLQAFLSRQLDNDMVDEMWSNFIAEMEGRRDQ
jgi:hypothetical protein